MPEPRRMLRARFWIDSAVAGAVGALALLTLFWHDWLEAFGWDPDHGDGTAEWVIVAVLATVALVAGALARWEWRRAQFA